MSLELNATRLQEPRVRAISKLRISTPKSSAGELPAPLRGDAMTLEGLQPPSSRESRGFLLVEHLVAAGILVVFALSALVAMVQANRFATASRLQAIALAMAQQRVDEVLTVPWNISSGRPAVLASGTRTEATLPLNNDS